MLSQMRAFERLLPRARWGGWLIGAAFAVAVSARPLAAEDGPLKVAVVDLESIVVKSPAGQELQARLEKFGKDAEASGQALVDEANALRERIRKGSASLKETEIEALQKSLEDKALAIRRYRDDKQREAEKLRQDGLEKIEKDLEPIFKAIREEGGFDLILNNVPGVVVMWSDRVEITALVLKRLGV